MTRRGGDSGSATVWVLALAALVSAVAGVLVLGVGVRAARARVATAADLAALAAAAQLPAVDLACAEAARVTAAQDVRLTTCTADGATVEVVAARDLDGPLRVLGPVMVRSRAGPPAGP